MRSTTAVELTRALAIGTALALAQVGATPAALAQQADTAKSNSAADLLRALQDLQGELERAEAGADEPLPEIVMISAPGSYPPGRYIGRCEVKRRPEDPQVGDSYEVRYVSSSFRRLEQDGTWNAVGSSSPPYSVPEYNCEADERDKDRAHFLGESWRSSIRGPGNYKLVVTGYVEHYVVKRCPTVGGGPCPDRVSREEISYEIPFEILPDR